MRPRFQLTDRKLPGTPSEEDWKFEAISLTASHDRDEDETYLYFGYWMNKPRDASGTPGFKWIRGGSSGDHRDYSITQTNLSGKAKYVGRATGQYAINTPGDTGKTELGTFTATATLNADFESDTDTLSGSITGFQAGSTSTEGWALSLKGPMASNDATTLESNTATGKIYNTDNISEIAGVPVSGDWGATLYGIDNHGDTRTAANKPDGATCQKTGCGAEVAGFAGWFKASGTGSTTSNASPIVAIGGAFATEPEPQ